MRLRLVETGVSSPVGFAQHVEGRSVFPFLRVELTSIDMKMLAVAVGDLDSWGTEEEEEEEELSPVT